MEHDVSQDLRHRHFVAFPLLVLTIAVTTAVSVRTDGLGAHIAGSLPEGMTSMNLPRGGAAILYDAAQFSVDADVPELTKGAVAVTSDGFLALYSTDLSMFGFHGAWHVTRTERALTVAALTTPVVVWQGNMRMIVPIGMQWTQETAKPLEALSAGPDAWKADRALTQLPAYFIREQLEHFSRLEHADDVLPQTVASIAKPLSVVTEALLPSARENAVAAWREQVLGNVRYALESHDAAVLTDLLQRAEFAEAFGSPEGRAGLLQLLATVPRDDTSLQIPLIEQLSHDETAWLLLSYHPDTDAVAWTFDRGDLPREQRFIRLFVLPFALLTAHDVPGIALERWKQGWNDILVSMDDTSLMAQFILSSSVSLLDRLNTLGYPERSRMLADTVSRLLTPFATGDSDLTEALADLRQRIDGPVSLLPETIEIPEAQRASVVSVASSSSSSSVPSMSPEEVIARAKDILRAADAVFTLRTNVEATEDLDARIENIVFASPSVDHTVSLTLNVVTGTLKDIEIDGEKGFPYTPRFESFVSWLKK